MLACSRESDTLRIPAHRRGRKGFARRRRFFLCRIPIRSMNDLMSGGLHRLWKAFAVALAGVREGEKVLDVAAGSGDLAFDFARHGGARRYRATRPPIVISPNRYACTPTRRA